MRIYKTILAILFCGMLQPLRAQRATDTFRLYFDLNVAPLSSAMQKKIDLLVYNDKIINGSSVTIVGYADYLGTEGYNKDLSMKRARNVKNYLVKYGIDSNDIKLCVGKGEIERSGKKSRDGFPTDRRVDIVVFNGHAKNAHAPRRHDTAGKTSVTSISDIKHLKPGSTFALKNVYFPAGRHIIRPESAATLEQLYTVLRDNPTMRISIEGHICCVMDAPDALDIDNNEPNLSVNRAKAIYYYLINKGIDSTRLTYRGFGRSRPVVPVEMTEADAEQNRRVEIRVLSK